MKKLTLALIAVVVLSVIGVSGCVIRDDFHHGSRWHHWR